MTVDVEDAYTEIGAILLDRTPLTAVLQRVVELARTHVPGADEASVTVVEGQRARSVAFTGDLAVQLDERQYEVGFGPCMDAALTGQVVRTGDVPGVQRAEDIYPGFSEVARRAGVVATLSVGLAVPGRALGALNLYSTDAGPGFDDTSYQRAMTFAGHAAIAVTNALAVDGTRELAEQMQRAMASRAVIEQAKGVLVARLTISAEEAFSLISRRSQNTNQKLAALAGDVVAAAQEGRDLGW